eukprot:TRINITY_DN3250_c0_g1_i3.p1 TRINITY_DN3250_c0_g1~~TRINITY_DN3250_c0_g1_i3.p1  ORF type:complete len:134 (+),score=25.21 TRINITY_DN3250_c0_g1_i3:951-1352(+)
MYLLVGVVLHLIYLSMLPMFPRIELTHFKFILSCVVLLLDHSLWFYYFTNEYHPFGEIIAFYVICVWLVPFSFFVGLTSNEDLLPYGSTIDATGEPVDNNKHKRGRLIVNFLEKARGTISKMFGKEKQNEYRF